MRLLTLNTYFLNYDVFLNIIILIVLLILYKKIVRIHLFCYQIAVDASVARNESESIFNQLHALHTLEKKLNLSESLPPMRGWAGSPDFLLVVAEEILCRKPKTVFECSSGVSTIVAARCLQIIGTGHVYSLEHSLEFADKSRKLLEKYGLNDWVTIIYAPLATKYTKTPWYDEDLIPKDMLPIDILIVDGPPVSTSVKLARYPALPRLFSRMADHFLLFIDDANRDDEVEMLKKWQNEYPELLRTDKFCEKGLVVLERTIKSES
jgi:hypothetical protein